MEPGSCQQCSVQDRRQQAQGVPSEHLAALLCCAVIEHWHRLPIGFGVPSLETFRSHLDMGTMLWVSLLSRGWGRWTQQCLQPEPLHVLMSSHH